MSTAEFEVRSPNISDSSHFPPIWEFQGGKVDFVEVEWRCSSASGAEVLRWLLPSAAALHFPKPCSEATWTSRRPLCC